MFSRKAQGAVEYLVLIAVMVIIALVAVSSLAASGDSAGGITAGVSKLTTQTSLVSISELFANPDTNVYLKLGNNAGEQITIKSITIGEDVNNFSAKIGMNDEQGFTVLQSTGCTEGVTQALDVVIIYETLSGLEKRQAYDDPLLIPCETSTINDPNVVVGRPTAPLPPP